MNLTVSGMHERSEAEPFYSLIESQKVSWEVLIWVCCNVVYMDMMDFI